MMTETPACFAFSMAKCGSTMMNRALGIVNDHVGMPETNLPGRFFREGVAVQDWTRRDLSDVVVDGYMHRGFRYMPANIAASPLIRTRKSILLLRDIRDAATSHFFSKLHEHPTPGGDLAKAFEDDRERIARKGIETHVLEQAKRLQGLWRRYHETLPDDPALVRVFRYEDVVFRKLAWLTEIYDFLEIDAPAEAIDAAVKAVDVFPETEDVKRRARKVSPGDHRDKLDAATIASLDALAADYQRANGYA